MEKIEGDHVRRKKVMENPKNRLLGLGKGKHNSLRILLKYENR